MSEIKRINLASFQGIFDFPGQQISAFQLALKAHELFHENVTPSAKISKRLDFLFHEFVASHPKFNDFLEGLAALNDFLFRKNGFKAIAGIPLSPDHVFIGKIMESRAGDSLPLALIYREMIRKMNLGVVDFANFPGMATVKVFFNHQLMILSPAEEGIVLSMAELQSRLTKRFGKNATLNSIYFETPSESQVFFRFLVKLKTLYFDLRDWTKLLGVLDLMVGMGPDKLSELKERGLLLYQLGFLNEAHEDLRHYIESTRASEDTENLKKLISHLQKPQVTPIF